jgi:hypothetical protein
MKFGPKFYLNCSIMEKKILSYLGMIISYANYLFSPWIVCTFK